MRPSQGKGFGVGVTCRFPWMLAAVSQSSVSMSYPAHYFILLFKEWIHCHGWCVLLRSGLHVGVSRRLLEPAVNVLPVWELHRDHLQPQHLQTHVQQPAPVQLHSEWPPTGTRTFLMRTRVFFLFFFKCYDLLVPQMRQYPQHMHFWDSQDITEDQKIDILKGIADILSGREINKDAQVTNSIHKGSNSTVSFCCIAVPSVFDIQCSFSLPATVKQSGEK